jgi:hypothetical protein
MKKITLPALFVLCLLTAACSKRNCCVPPVVNAYIGADKNSVKWTGEATAEKQGTDTNCIFAAQNIFIWASGLRLKHYCKAGKPVQR